MAKIILPESFYETTLANAITSTATTINVTTAPTQTSGYLVIESNTDNKEIIYYGGVTGTQLTGVVRGLAYVGTDDSGSATYQKSHPAGASIGCKDTHYYYGAFYDLVAGISSTGYNNFDIGDGNTISASDRLWYVRTSSLSAFWGMSASGQMVVSEDGITSYVISAGGSGLVAGTGIEIVAGIIYTNNLSTGAIANSAGKNVVETSGAINRDGGVVNLDYTYDYDWTGLHDFTDIAVDGTQISAGAAEINQMCSGVSAYSNLSPYNLNQVYAGYWNTQYGRISFSQNVSSKGGLGFVATNFPAKFLKLRGGRAEGSFPYFNHPEYQTANLSCATGYISANGTINGTWIINAAVFQIYPTTTYVYAYSTSAYGAAVSASMYFTITDFSTSGFSYKVSGSYMVGAGTDYANFYWEAFG